MTRDEATALVVALRSAFARPEWDRATVLLYTSRLEQLEIEPATEAVRQVVDSCVFRPAVAELLAAYRAARDAQRRLAADERGLDEPEMTEAERAENVRRIRELAATVLN